MSRSPWGQDEQGTELFRENSQNWRVSFFSHLFLLKCGVLILLAQLEGGSHLFPVDCILFMVLPVVLVCSARCCSAHLQFPVFSLFFILDLANCYLCCCLHVFLRYLSAAVWVFAFFGGHIAHVYAKHLYSGPALTKYIWLQYFSMLGFKAS